MEGLHMKRAGLFIILTTVLAMTVAACGGESETSAPATGQGETTAASSGGGELTVLAEDIPSGLDWDGPSVGIDASQTGMYNLADPLVYYAKGEVNDEGVQLLDFSKPEGRLAESWDYDPDTLTWTFHLRKNVVGCNGATFNADDVIYTFARAKSVSGQAPVAWFLSNTGSIDNFTADVLSEDTATAEAARKLGDEVTKVDDYTVTIRQSDPNKLLLPVLSVFALYILDKETMEEHATADDPWSHDYMNNENLPGFDLVPRQLEEESEFVVTANPDYYRGKPAMIALCSGRCLGVPTVWPRFRPGTPI